MIRPDTHFNGKLHRTAPAFTLIELLVVVAIISLLLAILLPSLRQARVQVKRVACGANLNQVAKAWTMYLDENLGRFPQGVNLNVNYGGQQGAGALEYRVRKPLNPYLQLPLESGKIMSGFGVKVKRRSSDAQIFRCPTDQGGEFVQPSHFEWYGTSYLMNSMLVGPNRLRILPGDPIGDVLTRVNDRLPGLNLSQVSSDTSKLILMGDYGWASTHFFSNPLRFEWHSQPCSHNLAFLDGHVKFTRISKGLHVTRDYITIPFRDLAAKAANLQVEVPCE